MDDKLSVDREVMDQFVYRSQTGNLLLTDLGYACIRKIFKFKEDYEVVDITIRDPTNQNKLMFWKGPEESFLIYVPTYPSSVTPAFEPKSFGEAMLQCAKSEAEVESAMEVGDVKGMDPYMWEAQMRKFLGGKRKKTVRGKKRRSTRRKHTLVKRRNVRMHRL
jgi:hypothetical protein